jgi:hypothetical protein
MSRWSDAFHAALLSTVVPVVTEDAGEEAAAALLSTAVAVGTVPPKKALNPGLKNRPSKDLDTLPPPGVPAFTIYPSDNSDNNRQQGGRYARAINSTRFPTPTTPLLSTVVPVVTGVKNKRAQTTRQSRILDSPQPQVEPSAFDPKAIAARLGQQLDAQNAASTARAQKAPATETRTSEPPPPDLVQTASLGAAVLPAEPLPPPPTHEPLVQRLAIALMTPRPWQRVTDPVRARVYFEARARHVLATARTSPLALVEREEQIASQFATVRVP